MPALFSLEEIAQAFGLKQKVEEPTLPADPPVSEVPEQPKEGGAKEPDIPAEPTPPAPVAKESVVPPVTATTSPSTIEEILNQPRDTRDTDTLRMLVEQKFGVRR